MPFIARYRKKITDILYGIQLRRSEERLHAFREFEKRYHLATILLTEQQNKMTPLLLEAIKYAKDRAQLD